MSNSSEDMATFYTRKCGRPARRGVVMPQTISIRGMVKEMQNEIRDTDLTPDRAATLQIKLSALLGSCSEEIREADAAYAQVLLGCLHSHEKANRARIVSEITPEFQRKREARDLRELVVELVRSLRHLGRVYVEEMRLQK